MVYIDLSYGMCEKKTLALLECEMGMLTGRREMALSPVCRTEEIGKLWAALMSVLHTEY